MRGKLHDSCRPNDESPLYFHFSRSHNLIRAVVILRHLEFCRRSTRPSDMTSRGVDSVPWFRSVVMLKFLNLSVLGYDAN